MKLVPKIPARAEIKSREIQPGDMIDGQYVGVPRYYRVRHVRNLNATPRYLAHARIDVPAKAVAASLAGLNGCCKQLAAYVARSGAHLILHAGGSASMLPMWGIGQQSYLRIGVWITVGHRIVAKLSITCGCGGRRSASWRGDDGVVHEWSRADVVVRL